MRNTSKKPPAPFDAVWLRSLTLRELDGLKMVAEATQDATTLPFSWHAVENEMKMREQARQLRRERRARAVL